MSIQISGKVRTGLERGGGKIFEWIAQVQFKFSKKQR